MLQHRLIPRAIAVAVFLMSSGCADRQDAPAVAAGHSEQVSATEVPQAPEGFVALFNGVDLQGWRGRPGNGGVFSPYTEARFTTQERAEIQAEWNQNRDAHWSVDAANREIVSDGHGVHLATEKAYADFELRLDWRFVKAGGDSGIYLRSYPQVQLWDPANPEEQKNGAERGSAALWNNNDDSPGKWPLVKADNPIGEWNHLEIKMVGSRVWVSLNGQTTVDGQIMNNFFDRSLPLLPSGSIELQTHGAETHFRNLFIREIGAEEAKTTLAQYPEAEAG